MKLNISKFITGALVATVFYAIGLYLGIYPLIAGPISGLLAGMIMPSPWEKKV